MNRLSDSHSPYLLQHAHQPVDWYPWGDEAFEKARRDDKPVFLSIGYATCHWCHVMAHESFEDHEVAALLNKSFICIKVDREEYPAVDSHFMAACHLMTGGGGWPLTVLTTPDRVPFYATTYIPKETQPPRMGMLDLIPRIADLWENSRNELTDAAGRIANAITAMTFVKPGQNLDPEILERAYQDLMHRFDAVHGGFDGAPKFPSPHNLLFLLRYWRRTGTWFAREMVEDTLEALRRGGIHDQIGGGFHRYATDETWTIPHFEKMLTDQAMLAIAFTEAFHATGNDRFGATVHDIIGYVLRDLAAPDGSFHTAEDADSMGGEGGFYLWREDELSSVLEHADTQLAIRAFGVTPTGNHYDEATHRPTGLNVLHLTVTEELLADEFGLTIEDCMDRLTAIREILYRTREDRPRPPLDDKILTDANGLMIAALAIAARVFGNNDWRDAAINAADWLLDTMRDIDGALFHRHHRGHTGIPGTLDDYQFLVWGLIELYETTFDARFLEEAIALVRIAINRFGDSDHGGFFLTALDDNSLPVRRKDAFDGALPSGNSVAVLNLTRLGRLTGDVAFETTAFNTCRAFASQIDRSLSAYTMLLTGYGMLTGGAGEVIIAGNTGVPDTQTLINALTQSYLPDTVVIFRPLDDPSAAIDQIVSGLGEYQSEDGNACAYVCRNRTCQLPTNDPDTMIAQLLRNIES